MKDSIIPHCEKIFYKMFPSCKLRHTVWMYQTVDVVNKWIDGCRMYVWKT
jgi:hypothetical protein